MADMLTTDQEAQMSAANADIRGCILEVKGDTPMSVQPASDRTTSADAQQRPADLGELGDDAYQVAQRYAIGEITREQMLDALSRWPYTPGIPAGDYWDKTIPTIQPEGTFGNTVGRAYHDGLISGEDYDHILDAYAID